MILVIPMIVSACSSTSNLSEQHSLPPSADISGQNIPDTAQNQIKRINEHEYQLGTLVLNSNKREITIPGKVNMQRGIIELLACGEGGKKHESVLVLDVVPYHMQVALLLLGLHYVGGLGFQGDPNTPLGDSVEVWVTWNNEKNTITVRGEDLIWDIPRNKPMEHTPWVFAGSRVDQGRFMADVERSLITTYHDPFTILDNPLPTGGNDELYKVNETLAPPKGTPVTVIIKALR